MFNVSINVSEFLLTEKFPDCFGLLPKVQTAASKRIAILNFIFSSIDPSSPHVPIKAGFAQRSAAKLGVRVQEPLQICLECRSKSKKCDKPINYTVRSVSF